MTGERDGPKTGTIAAISVAVGIAVLLIKLAAWRITGSVALFSDALESIVNVAASGAALVAIRYSLRPADANHPYGHHKAEYFSVVLEGVSSSSPRSRSCAKPMPPSSRRGCWRRRPRGWRSAPSHR